MTASTETRSSVDAGAGSDSAFLTAYLRDLQTGSEPRSQALSSPASGLSRAGLSNEVLVKVASNIELAPRREAEVPMDSQAEWLTGSREVLNEPGASRPVDPGKGHGIDVVVILREGELDSASSKDYIQGLRAYVKNVLKAPHVVDDVDALEDMFQKLDELSARSGRVRRIRVIGHGKPTGAVGVHDAGIDKKMRWMPPDEVTTFANDPEHRAVIRRVMAPNAVVEFWGCSIANSKTAMAAWATLFQSRFLATTEKIGNSVFAFGIPKSKEKPGVGRPATNSSEIDALGPIFAERFRDSLELAYHQLVADGKIDPVSDDEAVNYMIRLFNAGHGQIFVGPTINVLDKRGREIERVEPGAGPYWDSLWHTFEPIAFDKPSNDVPAPKPSPAPAPAPAPATQPPVAIVQPPSTPPPVAQAFPTTREEAKRPQTPEPQTPVVPAPELLPPPAVHEGPSALAQAAPPKKPRTEQPEQRPPKVSQAKPTQPQQEPPKPEQRKQVSSEIDWSRLHRPGKVESPAPGRWILWNFDVGSGALKPEHAHALDEIAKLLQATGAESPVVSITGHASSSGASAVNARLSLARARAVAADLRRRPDAAAAFEVSASTSTTISPEQDAEALARDRSVEIQVSAPARQAPFRKPLEPPGSKKPSAWKDVDPVTQPKHGIANYIPGFAFEGKLPIEYGRIPLSPDFLLIVEGELGLKFEFTTRLPVDTVLALKAGKLDGQIKATLHDFVFTGKLDEGKVGIQFKGHPLKPEVEVGIVDLLTSPAKLKEAVTNDPKKLFKLASLKLTLPVPVFETDSAELGNRIPALKGIKFRLKVTPKAVFSIAPSPALIGRLAVSLGGRLGTAGGPIAAGVVIAAGWTFFSLYLIDEAHKRGERWADVVNFREGYARRLAAEVADWSADQPRSNRAWNTARDEMVLDRYDYRQSYEGWQAADEAINRLPLDLYKAAMKLARDRFGKEYANLQRQIFKRIGGASKDPIRLPANPTLIEY